MPEKPQGDTARKAEAEDRKADTAREEKARQEKPMDRGQEALGEGIRGRDQTDRMEQEAARNRELHRGEVARAEAMAKVTDKNDASGWEGSSREVAEAHRAADEAVPPDEATRRRIEARKKMEKELAEQEERDRSGKSGRKS